MRAWTLKLLAACSLAAPLVAAPEAARQPEVKAGPYRVTVDRVLQNRRVTLSFRTDVARRDGGIQSGRSVQVHLGVFAPDAGVASGLTLFQVSSVTVDGGKRALDLPHNGGMLENANDTAVLRAYVHVPNVPPAARELRSIEGQIMAWEKSGPLEIELPVADGKLPVTVEKEGVKATVRDLTAQGGTVELLLSVEGPPDSVLANPATDGTYGVSVLNADAQAATQFKGALASPRPNRGEYRLGFSNLKGAPAKVQVRLLYRAGPRRTYPFKLEHVPIPSRLPGPEGS
jgi:hypothetical protein